MRLSLLTFLTVFTLQNAIAQDCANCNNQKRVVLYDADVQVPKPAATDSLSQWQLLIQIATSIDVAVFKNSSECVNLVSAFTVYGSGAETIVVGANTTNLPSSDIDGDYLVTGTIKAAGEQYILEVELQAGCSRKVIAKGSSLFDLKGDLSGYSKIVSEAVSSILPIAGKIQQFESSEKQRDKSLSLLQIGEIPVKITPQKKILKAGESTVFNVEIIDCDGSPIQGREIVFTEMDFNGMKLFKTLGGTVSPTKLVTDANGKATGTFTLKPGATEALISAHSPGKDVAGCESIFSGSAAINIKATYSGYVKYQLEMTNNCTKENTSGCLYTQNKWKNVQSISFGTSFYTTQERGETLDISLTDDENQQDGSLVPDLLAHGTFSHMRNDLNRGVIVCESANKGEETIQRIISNVEGGLGKASIRISESGGFAAINLDLVFDTNTSSFFSQTALPSANENKKEKTDWNVAFDTIIEKGLKVKKTKTAGKTTYTFQGSRGTKLACGSTNETIVVVVNEE